MGIPKRDEMGPELPNSNSTSLLCGDHLTLSYGADVARLQPRYTDMFCPLPGCTDLIQHHTETHQGMVVRSRPYQLAEHMRKVVQEEMGVIEESNSSWCSPIVLVAKKDGTVQFCVDYRKVNDASQFDTYPMPRVDKLLDRLGMAHCFMTLDLTKANWQIPLSPLSKEKTAFSTPYGLYHMGCSVPCYLPAPHEPSVVPACCICGRLLG